MKNQNVENPTKPGISLAVLALLLTVLDKEHHNALYFQGTHPEQTDTQYTEALRNLQFQFLEQLDPELKEKLLAENPHLSHLDPDAFISLDV